VPVIPAGRVRNAWGTQPGANGMVTYGITLPADLSAVLHGQTGSLVPGAGDIGVNGW
jgi:hypothetical protein